MKIEADRTRCEGHRMCVVVAPAVYDLDDDAVVVLRIPGDAVPVELEHSAAAGARACPVAALRVAE